MSGWMAARPTPKGSSSGGAAAGLTSSASSTLGSSGESAAATVAAASMAPLGSSDDNTAPSPRSLSPQISAFAVGDLPAGDHTLSPPVQIPLSSSGGTTIDVFSSSFDSQFVSSSFDSQFVGGNSTPLTAPSFGNGIGADGGARVRVRHVLRHGGTAPSMKPVAPPMLAGARSYRTEAPLADRASEDSPAVLRRPRAMGGVQNPFIHRASRDTPVQNDANQDVSLPISTPPRNVEVIRDPRVRAGQSRLARLTLTPYSFSALGGTTVEERRLSKAPASAREDFLIVKIDVAPICDRGYFTETIRSSGVNNPQALNLQSSFKAVRFPRRATAAEALTAIAQKNVDVKDRGLFIPPRRLLQLPFGRWIRSDEELAGIVETFGVSWLELRRTHYEETLVVERCQCGDSVENPSSHTRTEVKMEIDPFVTVFGALHKALDAANDALGIELSTRTHALYLEAVLLPRIDFEQELPAIEEAPSRQGIWINHSHESVTSIEPSLLCHYPLPQRLAHAIVDEDDQYQTAPGSIIDYRLVLRPRQVQPVNVLYIRQETAFDGSSEIKRSEQLVYVDPFWTIVYAKRFVMRALKVSDDPVTEKDFKLLLRADVIGTPTHVWLRERARIANDDGSVHVEPLCLLDYFNEYDESSMAGAFTIHIRAKKRQLHVQLPDGVFKHVDILERDPVSTVLQKLAPTFDVELDHLPHYALFGASRNEGSTMFRLDYLDEFLSLSQHGIDLSEPVYLRRRFPFSPDGVRDTDDVSLRLLHYQLKEYWDVGVLKVADPEKVILMAALLAQGLHGDYSATMAKRVQQGDSWMLPEQCRGYEDDITRCWIEMRERVAVSQARYQFIQMCRLPLGQIIARSLSRHVRSSSGSLSGKVKSNATSLRGKLSEQVGKMIAPRSPAVQSHTHSAAADSKLPYRHAHATGLVDQGPIEVSVRGMTRNKVLPGKKLQIVFDFTNLSVTFADIEKGKVVLQLTKDMLSATKSPELRVERNAADPTQMSLVNYLHEEKLGQGLLNSCDLTCRNPAECELLCSFLNRCRGIPAVYTFRIWTGTWNLGGGPPPQLHDWLPAEKPSEGATSSQFPDSSNFDIIVVATQEAKWSKKDEKKAQTQDLEPGTSPSVVSSDNFQTRVHQHIGVNKFEELASVSMWEIALTVFVSRDIRNLCTGVEKATRPTGIANVCGNKGGVAISFYALDTHLCFVNSHLPARHTEERLAARNYDYQWLCEGLHVGAKGKKGSTLLNQFEHIFWIGDLNYRIDLSRDRIEQYVDSANYAALVAQDQLRVQVSEEKAFSGFAEGAIGFPPTYRWERYQRIWSTKKLQNTPSYTDRILWRSNFAPQDVTQKEYRWAETIMSSDHRPVGAVFSLVARSQATQALISNPEQVFLCTGQLVLYDMVMQMTNSANLVPKLSVPEALTRDVATKVMVVGVREHQMSIDFKNTTKVGGHWKPDQGVMIFGPFIALCPVVNREVRFQFVLHDPNSVVGGKEKIGTAVIRICTKPRNVQTQDKPESFRAAIYWKGLVWGEIRGYHDFQLFGGPQNRSQQ